MPLNFKKDSFRYQKYLSEAARLTETRKARVYTSLVLTFFTISFFALFALRPTLLTIAGLIADIKREEEISSQLGNKIQQLSLAQTAYSQVAPKLYLVDEALPTKTEFSSCLGNLEMAAGENEVSFTSLSFGEISINDKKEELQEIDFETSLEGQFENLKSFLEKFFSFRRIIQSSQFALIKNEQETEQSLSLSARLVTFFQAKKLK